MRFPTRNRDVRELVLLALHHIGKACILLEKTKVELNNDFAARAIPDAKLWLDHTPADHFLDQAQVFKHGKLSRVSRRGMPTIADTRFRLKNLNREVLPG